MTKILIIAEHDNQSLNDSTAKCVSCATKIGGEIDILVLGTGVGNVASEAASIQGVSIVHVTDAPHLEAPLAANWATEIAEIASDYSHVLGPSSTLGRDLLPRVAALLGVNQISDIMEV
ncbi:MAG: electron transfer flavoprotein subunit alpha/FixB family protein, partial [bacterium]